MKRLIALLVLGIGIIPSIPVFQASALASLQQSKIESYCRQQLGYGPTDYLQGAFVFNLRRCINTTTKKVEEISAADRMMQRQVQQIGRRDAIGQKFLRVTRRSLLRSKENQEKIRKSYYLEVPLASRHLDLLRHKAERRTVIRDRERDIVFERRVKIQRWRDAMNFCRHYLGTERNACLRAKI